MSGKGCVVNMIPFTKNCETLTQYKIIITLANMQTFKGIKERKGCLSAD